MKRSMRWVVSGVAVLGLAQSAVAADLDFLRGSEVFAPGPAVYSNWSGFYFGAQAGYANANMDFTSATSPLIAQMLRNTALLNGSNVATLPVLGRADVRGGNYGGFVGYNSQWENVVLGMEASYIRADLRATSSGVTPGDDIFGNQYCFMLQPGDGLNYCTRITGSATMHITDYGELKGRAGYVMGRFLPYLTVGFVMGRAETTRAADVTALVHDPTGRRPDFVFENSITDAKTAYPIGYSVGGGMDVALTSNFFLRGEFEWLQFARVEGITANITTGRVGAGVKF